MNIVSVICARNEEKYLHDTLEALYYQSLPLTIIVVDDGSIDDTRKIAYAFHCRVISLPAHEESYWGKPQLSTIWNVGLKAAKDLSPNYVLIMGADHILPSDYVETLVERMEADRGLMVCSGIIENESWEESTPRGSGRLVRADFWSRLNSLQYPVSCGGEEYLLFKALQLGYKIQCFPDVRSRLMRPTKQFKAPDRSMIPAMYVLGYPWEYILVRLGIKKRMPLSEIIQGIRLTKNLKKLDVADFVKLYHRKKMLKLLKFW